MLEGYLNVEHCTQFKDCMPVTIKKHPKTKRAAKETETEARLWSLISMDK